MNLSPFIRVRFATGLLNQTELDFWTPNKVTTVSENSNFNLKSNSPSCIVPLLQGCLEAILYSYTQHAQSPVIEGVSPELAVQQADKGLLDKGRATISLQPRTDTPPPPRHRV